MKSIIPISQLNEEVSGGLIERLNDAYVEAAFDEIGKAHRNDHFICILLEKGGAEVLVDFKKIELTPSALLFLHPEQIKSLINYQNSEGWVLYFSRNLVNHHVAMIFEESLYQGSILQLSAHQKDWVLKAFYLISSTIASREMISFQQLALDSLVSACIYQIASIYTAKMQLDTKENSSRKIDIARTFRRLLLQHYTDIKSPREYAAMMNISLGYLNDTLKLVTGQNVSNSIQHIAVIEAQRLLYHSTLSIKEIAQKVGYDDAQYFSRIFSKITKKTPGNFRKKVS